MRNVKNFQQIPGNLILVIASISFIYPFYWMIMASLLPEESIGSFRWIPSKLTLENYSEVVARIPIGLALFNSLFVALLSTTGVVIFGAMTGYALAKLSFPGRTALFFIIVFTMSLPFQVTLIPNYILMVKLKLTDTLAALILPALQSTFAILLFRQAFKPFPDALIDAARMDGCSEWTIVFRILMPNTWPTVITVAIISFMNAWNDVLWPLIVIRDEATMTMPQLVTLFAVGGRAEAQLGIKLASAVMLALPVMIAFILFQRHFIRSMASTGLKD
jgi:multiple sugar transport system permease protein